MSLIPVIENKTSNPRLSVKIMFFWTKEQKFMINYEKLITYESLWNVQMKRKFWVNMKKTDL